MALPELFNDPVYLAGLVLVLFVLVQWQRTLTWTEYRKIHGFKVRLFPVLSQFVSLFLIGHKRGRDDAEFIKTDDRSVKDVFKALADAGGSPHLLCSIKKRPNPDSEGSQYSAAHVVWIDDEDQLEAYMFENDDGTTDIYSHAETSVLDPDGHLTDKQRDGDPEKVIVEALRSSQD